MAFIDNGASKSFVSKRFVEQNINSKFIQEMENCSMFTNGTEIPRLGEVIGVTLENGKRILQTNLEVADLQGDEDLVIGRDLISINLDIELKVFHLLGHKYVTTQK